jgi:hypothetical protein
MQLLDPSSFCAQLTMELIKCLPLFSREPLAHNVKELLLSRLWPLPPGTTQPGITDYDAYFSYLRHECIHAQPAQHSMKSFADLILLVDILRGNPRASLADIRSLAREADAVLAADERQLSSSIELATRIWIMVSVNILLPENKGDCEVSLPWAESQSLTDVLNRHLCHTPRSRSSAREQFSDYFNVTDMNNIANFRVLWTDNLCDHLVIKGSCLYVFHHVSVLDRLKVSLQGNFLPVALADETKATLNLIIPHSMTKCNHWLQTEVSRLGLDANIVYRQTAERSHGAFTFWQERLLSLSDSFDNAKPSSPVQWWYDRRDMGQWWGFWLLVAGVFLTVVFGLVQSVTGILQVISRK